jgi:hypothetical protein
VLVAQWACTVVVAMTALRAHRAAFSTPLVQRPLINARSALESFHLLLVLFPSVLAELVINALLAPSRGNVGRSSFAKNAQRTLTVQK